MSLTDRVLEALKDVEERGFNKAPPLYRLCWRLGILVPPPLLAGFWINFLFMGGFFSAAFTAMVFSLPTYFLPNGTPSDWHRMCFHPSDIRRFLRPVHGHLCTD
jgi:hypothetical protein